MDAYLDCLQTEAQTYKDTPVETVYVGGGTPTFMAARQIERLFHIIKRNFRYFKENEITIEANPEDIEPVKAKLLFDLGVNRISVGVQTFNDKYLKYLGRCHDSQKAFDAYAVLRKAGFQNINVDLMYAFPEQTDKELADDVAVAAGLGSEHLSLYTLTVDEHSRFYTQKIKEKDNHAQGSQYQRVVESLDKAGFSQYEISNFAKLGQESRHNKNYWLGGNYVGLGVGAHSHKEGERFWNTSKFQDYLARVKAGQSPREGTERLTSHERLTEALLLGLRMNEGVKIQSMETRYQCSLSNDKKKKLRDFVSAGFLWEDNGTIGAELKGKRVLDELSVQLL